MTRLGHGHHRLFDWALRWFAISLHGFQSEKILYPTPLPCGALRPPDPPEDLGAPPPRPTGGPIPCPPAIISIPIVLGCRQWSTTSPRRHGQRLGKRKAYTHTNIGPRYKWETKMRG